MSTQAKCECGAAVAKHPTSGYSDAGKCLEALKASNVKCGCDWPNCARTVRKHSLGGNFCRPHHDRHWSAVMALAMAEGPICLSRGCATLTELEEFSRTGKVPKSRQFIPVFEQTKTTCADCGDKLVIFNDHGFVPHTFGPSDSRGPWKGIGVCRTCSASVAKRSFLTCDK